MTNWWTESWSWKKDKNQYIILYIQGFCMLQKWGVSGFKKKKNLFAQSFFCSNKSLNAIQQLIYNYNIWTFCCPWYLPFPSQPSSLSEPFLIWFSLEMVQDFLDLSSLTTLSKEENKILVSMLHKVNVSWFDVQKVHTPVLLISPEAWAIVNIINILNYGK